MRLCATGPHTTIDVRVEGFVTVFEVALIFDLAQFVVLGIPGTVEHFTSEFEVVGLAVDSERFHVHGLSEGLFHSSRCKNKILTGSLRKKYSRLKFSKKVTPVNSVGQPS